MKSLGFPLYKITSSANKDNFTYFSIWMPFIPFSYLIALARDFQYHVEEEWWEWAPLSYSWSLRKWFQTFAIHYDVSCGFLIYDLYYVEVYSFHTQFFECLYYGKMWIFPNALPPSIEMIIWFLSFIILMWYITFIDLHMLNHSCINFSWSWCMILLVCCWILFASILLKIFASILIRDIGL